MLILSAKDPNVQLEQLRRNSLLASDLKIAPRKSIPDRKMPGTAVPVLEETAAQLSAIEDEPHVPLGGGGSPHVLDVTEAKIPEALPLVVGGEEAAAAVKSQVAFSEPDFESKDAGVGLEKVEVLSPTQTAEAS
jgi:hypothetical protein